MKIVGSVERTRRDSTYRNSDLAFWGRLAYAGHYDGFQIIDVSNPDQPRRLVDHPCPGLAARCLRLAQPPVRLRRGAAHLARV